MGPSTHQKKSKRPGARGSVPSCDPPRKPRDSHRMPITIFRHTRSWRNLHFASGPHLFGRLHFNFQGRGREHVIGMVFAVSSMGKLESLVGHECPPFHRIDHVPFFDQTSYRQNELEFNQRFLRAFTEQPSHGKRSGLLNFLKHPESNALNSPQRWRRKSALGIGSWGLCWTRQPFEWPLFE